MKLMPKNNQRHPMVFHDFMNRFFEDSWRSPFDFFENSLLPENRAVMNFMPDIDVYETDKEFVIEANIPGYDPGNIEIEIEEGVVSIRGKTEQSQEEVNKDKKYYRRERSYGEFYQEIALPAYVDSEKANCKAKNGIMTVAIPKKTQSHKKQLKVNIE